MSWSVELRKWIPCISDLPNLVMHRSTTTRSGKVTIRVATRLDTAPIEFEVYSDGYYLISEHLRICLLRKTGNAVPQTLIKKEYTIADAYLPAIETNVRLWRLAPVPTPVPTPPQVQTLKPIPRRIAWIIAEDASKNNESCPITTNELSPLKAAVTTCFHVFETDSLSEWFARNPITKCPVCREVCLMTKAYDES
jgi:hypothetical protein